MLGKVVDVEIFDAAARLLNRGAKIHSVLRGAVRIKEVKEGISPYYLSQSRMLLKLVTSVAKNDAKTF